MKKFILGFCLIAMLASCGSKNEQWEYKEKIIRRNEIHCSIHINSIGSVVLFP